MARTPEVLDENDITSQNSENALFRARRRAVTIGFFLGLALVILAWANFNVHYFQAQARYWHPALVPVAAFWALGFIAITEARGPKFAHALSGIFSLVLIAITLGNAFGWRTLV